MIKLLTKLCSDVIIEELLKLHKPIKIDCESIEISRISNFNYGHFQLNNCVFLSRLINNDVYHLYKLIFLKIRSFFSVFDIVVSFSVPCFINFKFSSYFIESQINKNLLGNSIILKLEPSKNIFLDYSSPNVAKEMHVGHLRSTIIGNFFSNLFRAVGYKVIKVSHVGDWGTQFGILINYLKRNIDHEEISKLTLKKLDSYYKKANLCFQQNESFNSQAREEVVKLQCGDKYSLSIWRKINRISRLEYNRLYKLLDVKIEYKGESYYKNLLDPIIHLCENKKLVVLSDNAKCIYVDGFLNINKKPLPVIIQKSDQGYNYSTTELASLYYRIKYHKPDKIIYITDIGQKNHFSMIFKIIHNLIKVNTTKLLHIGFGLMLNDQNKKIKTRSGKSEKLKDFIKNSVKIVNKKLLKNSNKKLKLSYILAVNTIKYAELSNKLSQNYVFNYDRLLKTKGNTAMFLMYAYARICSIKRKSKIFKLKNIISNYKVVLFEIIELDLALDLIQYDYIIFKTVCKLDPTILSSYLYDIAEKFHRFFHSCNVLSSDFMYSRLLLCEIIRHILFHSFKILGIKPVSRI